MSVDYIIDADRWLRIHTDFDIASAVIGSLPTGTKVAVDSIVGEWAKVPLSIGGAAMTTDDTTLIPVYGYMFAALMHPVVPVPPPPVKTVWRNATGVHFLASRTRAIEAVKKGCRDFVFMDDWDSCRWAADALGKTAAFDVKGTVMYRHWIQNWPNFDQVMSQGMHVGEDGRIVRIVTNECENIGKDGVGAIQYHAELDVKVARECAKHGIHVALGTFPVGNPDITKPEICAAMKAGYSDWWNNGFAQTGIRPVWDQHEYSPDEKHIHNTWEGPVDFGVIAPGLLAADMYEPEVHYDIVGRANTQVSRIHPRLVYAIIGAPQATKRVYVYEQDWHETRAKFLFALCGFNLTSGGVLMSSETGIDRGGSGGFIGCGLDAAAAVKWVKRFQEIWQRPVSDDFGNTCPMPKESACIFQGSDAQNGTGRWGSYYCGSWENELAQVWGK